MSQAEKVRRFGEIRAAAKSWEVERRVIGASRPHGPGDGSVLGQIGDPGREVWLPARPKAGSARSASQSLASAWPAAIRSARERIISASPC